MVCSLDSCVCDEGDKGHDVGEEVELDRVLRVLRFEYIVDGCVVRHHSAEEEEGHRLAVEVQ